LWCDASFIWAAQGTRHISKFKIQSNINMYKVDMLFPKFHFMKIRSSKIMHQGISFYTLLSLLFYS
jgi:hypothetical protein